MTKAELIEAVRSARAEWEMLLADVSPSLYEQPGVSGQWSVKDVIAHIAWHEREVARALQARDFTDRSPWWLLPTEERNRNIYEANRDRPFAEVLAEAQVAYADLLAAVQMLSEDDLANPSRFTNHPPGVLPWEIIDENSCDHYRHHIVDLQNWLV